MKKVIRLIGQFARWHRNFKWSKAKGEMSFVKGSVLSEPQEGDKWQNEAGQIFLRSGDKVIDLLTNKEV